MLLTVLRCEFSIYLALSGRLNREKCDEVCSSRWRALGGSAETARILSAMWRGGAHKGRLECDPWYEETEWHRSWKDRFPLGWQEQIAYDPVTGEKHIADVRTPSDPALGD
jgi:hypothetical protein